MPITSLSSGGVIVCYRCPAACGHCMYGSAPDAEPSYITEETARAVFKQVRKLGCRSLHIGGGEPFLQVDGLLKVLRVMRESGIALDYIETNAAWITGDRARDQETLFRVVEACGDCIMVSADPFHVAFIPFWKPRTLINLLRETGISHFIWQERYLPLLAKLDPQRTYDGPALEQALGYDVLGSCTREYGMGFNGRALNLIRPAARKQRAETLLREKPCAALWNTGHFHVDLLGRYIPAGCTGMGILVEDLPQPLSVEAYPVLSRLCEGGTAALWVYAQARGFTPEPDGYASNCDLCFQMRKFLALQEPEQHPDLSPASFYRQDF